ncbi:MAG: hydroxymethylglutaryl-CoA lyase [Flavobacteriales bacterium]
MMKLVECPRDAMQGIHDFIPTSKKISYLNALLKVGYHVLDFGSFVSPKAIPQLKDTAEVLANLELENTNTELLAIVANSRGAEDACKYNEIMHLGFPLSASETFQKRNTNKSIAEALQSIEKVQNLAVKHNKKTNIYLSMGFGNPYEEAWHPDILAELTLKLRQLEIEHIIPSDTIGVSNPTQIIEMFGLLKSEFQDVEWGAHLHSSPDKAYEKINAMFNSGCDRLDMAVKGFGGCPMAKDDLVGNIATEKVISYMNEQKIDSPINALHFESAYNKGVDIFNHYL